jgi:hypothetical protein
MGYGFFNLSCTLIGIKVSHMSTLLLISGYNGGFILAGIASLILVIAWCVWAVRKVFFISEIKKQLESQTRLLKEIARQQDVSQEGIESSGLQ